MDMKKVSSPKSQGKKDPGEAFGIWNLEFIQFKL